MKYFVPSLLLIAALGGTTAARANSDSALQSREVTRRLDDALRELARVREQASARTIPLSQEITRQEQALLEAREQLELERAELDSRHLALNNLRERIKARTQEERYLSNLMGEYVRNLETQLHIAQTEQYAPSISNAKLALDDESMAASAVFAAQMQVVDESIRRLQDLVGGMRFTGQAVDEGGALTEGQFAMVGPHAFFASNDGSTVGQAVERLGSLKPNVLMLKPEADDELVSFDPEVKAAATTGVGMLPLDSTLGKAHKVAETRETLVEHIMKGGIVIYPILGVAAFATLVVLSKAVQLYRLPIPPPQIVGLIARDLSLGRYEAAAKRAARMRGPIATILNVLIEHINDPRELIEELMFERVIEARMKLNSGLPFVAVCAASAPLLGLLGTVTGIISTFKLITAFGSGDIKMLSAGISEALVTTECGLYVAIPSLVCHAFLSRRAKSVVENMEKTGLTVLNQLGAANAENDKTERGTHGADGDSPVQQPPELELAT